MRPLDGIRVLDLSRLLPGPFLTMILADMGADVIKIEDPRLGDYLRNIPPLRGGSSGRYLSVNRDKRSIELDLKTASGRNAFLEMVKQADVVVESFRPGVMDRLGLGYEVLSEHNAKVIVCSISGFGQTGPYRLRAGHDLNYIGLAGVLAMGGQRQGAPALPGVQIADLAGGALWGATGILGALVGRHRDGKGAHLDISMTEGAMALLAAELGNQGLPDGDVTRGEGTLNGALACYRVYRCKDGGYVSIAALEPKFWMALGKAIGRDNNPAELMAPADKQEAIAEELATIIATKSRDEWAAIFAEHDCCCDAIFELAELKDHPLHKSRGVFFEMDGGDGEAIPQLRLPVGQPRGQRPPPTRGQHTEEVLAEFGIDASALEE
jgi:crotonobetainyl-CoA:carnitine CoA-transferase CaiB-like acyl-CoA transferase